MSRRLVLGILAALLPAAAHAQSGEVNVYTTREPALIQPLFDGFTKDTGIKVNSIFVKDGLTERVAAEAANSPADLLITVDFGKLIEAVDAGVTQPIASERVFNAVADPLHGAAGEWVALSLRARVLYVSKERQGQLKGFTYEELADPKWKGKVCLRSGQHPYNTALIAAYIAHHGEAKAEEWLKGVKANLARKPGGGDRDVAKDILAGTCDIGLANSYYVGLMRNGKDEEQKKWGAAINVVLPTFVGGGTHVNVSGAAITKNAPNKDNAVKLVEYLISPEAQAIYAKVNYEYPVARGAEIEPTIGSFGTLQPDTVALTEVAKHRKAASALVDKVGFDN